MKLRVLMVGMAMALAGTGLAVPASAAKPAPPSYPPPVNVTVTCTPVASVVAPRGTAYVQYSLYLNDDPAYDYNASLDAWNPSESGPGYTKPDFPAVYQKGGPEYPTPSAAKMIWAEAQNRKGEPIGWGFATCWGNTAFRLVTGFDSATNSVIVRDTDGTLIPYPLP